MDSSEWSESAAGTKRKRSPGVEEGRQSAPPPPASHGVAPAAPAPTPINYLVKAKSERLRLIEGDSETFSEVLSMIDDYEGVLNRHESFAGNLGARLIGPRVLKSLEKMFESPIKVIQSSFAIEQTPVTWFDITTFSVTNLADFVVSKENSVTRWRFWIKGGQVEISDYDHDLLVSGVPQRIITPSDPHPNDESSELGTLSILEDRLGMLIKKADAVASKARQLRYHLKGRKTTIAARKTSEHSTSASTELPQTFAPVNPRTNTPQPNSESAVLQKQLMDQFLEHERRTSLPQSRPKASRPSTDGFHTYNGQDPETRRMANPTTASSSENDTEGRYRAIMAAKIEKLERGDPINPPCDRCRRLKFDCTKHLTACQACTKKHAKCSWKDVQESEIDYAPSTSITTPRPQTTGTYAANDQSPEESSMFVSPAEQRNHQMLSVTREAKMEDASGTSEEHSKLAEIATAAAAANQGGSN
ncbi:uncharacterized protein LY89DRAFT_680350 [Mollisia scopiformis]|uniref:Zn(2)-C6 fungal-type domain-containing protein n=1 Tax=Mollisia scopiformis TaxID=149040 RepID=A0A194XV93_MOLSC|nr:uncharacterized protein LY89DRAFT_680350 [Mollisia scopiformis]KUJ23632.1 hypothetical protein LY89DRAFT_680350 [Mollisia scopiformis]